MNYNLNKKYISNKTHIFNIDLLSSGLNDAGCAV